MRCLADGNAPVGYLRRDGGKIHRNVENKDEDKDDQVIRPPQEALNAQEEAEWQEKFAENYAP